MLCIPSLHTACATSTFTQSFFAPLLELLVHANHRRVCPELTDQDWLRLGVRRTIEDRPSGRAFLQHLALSGVEGPEHSHFFETLKSARRLALVSEVSSGLAAGKRAGMINRSQSAYHASDRLARRSWPRRRSFRSAHCREA